MTSVRRHGLPGKLSRRSLTSPNAGWLVSALLAAVLVAGWIHPAPRDPASDSPLRAIDDGPLLPAELAGSRFNASLGCWQVVRHSSGEQARVHLLADINYSASPERWAEILTAVNLTQSSNPQLHYVFVTKSLELLGLLAASRVQRYDAWYCPEVLYATPLAVGNLYAGVKIAANADGWWPPINFECTFISAAGKPVAYLLPREERADLSGDDTKCEVIKGLGGWDGLLYSYIPPAVLANMRFPRYEDSCLHSCLRTDSELHPLRYARCLLMGTAHSRPRCEGTTGVARMSEAGR